MSIRWDSDEDKLVAAIDLHPRHISPEELRKFEDYMVEIFTAFGMNPNTPGTVETPQRFVRALLDATNGYEGDSRLLKMFPTECRGVSNCRLNQVIEGPIHFYALCEHHALPFYGLAYVGYIASENIIGISKLTRLVH